MEPKALLQPTPAASAHARSSSSSSAPTARSSTASPPRRCSRPTCRSRADRLLHFFGADQVLAQWLKTEWLPRKVARAAQLRDYVETTWPEFDWYCRRTSSIARLAEADGGSARSGRPASHEALARCVATAQGGIFYRSLARWADDRRLRELARAMARGGSAVVQPFPRRSTTAAAQPGPRIAPRRGRTALALRAHRARHPGAARVQRDHRPMRGPRAVSRCSSTPSSCARMGSVIERHGNLGTPERILFRTWKGRPRVRIDDVAAARTRLVQADLQGRGVSNSGSLDFALAPLD